MTSRRLNRSVVIEAAAARIDADGSSTLTMTDLARSLGVQGPTLYSHVQSVEELLGLVQVEAHRSLSDRIMRSAAGRTRADGFRAMAEALRSFAQEHPGLYDLAMSEVIDRPAVHAAGEPSATALAAVIESFGVESSLELQVNCLATLHGVLVLDRSRFWGDAVDLDAVWGRAVDTVILLLEREGGTP